MYFGNFVPKIINNRMWKRNRKTWKHLHTTDDYLYLICWYFIYYTQGYRMHHLTYNLYKTDICVCVYERKYPNRKKLIFSSNEIYRFRCPQLFKIFTKLLVIREISIWWCHRIHITSIWDLSYMTRHFSLRN